MQLSIRATLLLAAICTVIGVALALGHGRSAGATPLPSPLSQSESSPCDVSIVASVEPEEVILGDVVDVILRASYLCPPEYSPFHLALVLDGSGSMTAESLDVMKSSAKAVVAELRLELNPRAKVSVVEYAERATIRCELTADVPKIEACIDAVGADGPTAIDEGIKGGLTTLTSGRSGISSSDEIQEVLIVYSDSESSTGCGPVEEEAIRAKKQDVLVITSCGGDECAVDCLRRVATTAWYAFDTDNPRELLQVFSRFSTFLGLGTLFHLRVSDEFVENMVYVPDSAVPAPIAESIGLGRLDWQYSYVPAAGITMTWKVRPTEIGNQTVSAGTVATYRDNWRRTGEVSAASVSVNVVAPLESTFMPYAENP